MASKIGVIQQAAVTLSQYPQGRPEQPLGQLLKKLQDKLENSEQKEPILDEKSHASNEPLPARAPLQDEKKQAEVEIKASSEPLIAPVPPQGETAADEKSLGELTETKTEVEAKVAPKIETETSLVEKLRRALRDELNQERAGVNTAYYDGIFNTLIGLAQQWPTNKPGEVEGTYDDLLFIDDAFFPGDPKVIATTSGPVYYKESFEEHFTRNNAFKVVGANILVNDPFGNTLSEREINYLKNNGVNIPRPDLSILTLNRALGLGGQPIAQGRGRAGLSLNYPATVGGVAGLLIGLIVGYAALIALIAVCPPLPLLAELIMIGVGLTAGLVSLSRGGSFYNGTMAAYAGSIIVMSALALFFPPLLALVVGAVASNSAAASAIAGWSFVQPFIPAALLLAGAINEAFNPRGMERMFSALITYPLRACAAIFVAIGALMGKFVSLFMGRSTPAIQAAPLGNANANNIDPFESPERVVNTNINASQLSSTHQITRSLEEQDESSRFNSRNFVEHYDSDFNHDDSVVIDGVTVDLTSNPEKTVVAHEENDSANVNSASTYGTKF